MANSVQLHRASIAALTSNYVTHLADTDLARPTPCSGWDLRQLLEHMIGQHAGFAEVVRTGAATPDAYHPLPFALASWQTSVNDLVAAFAAADLTHEVVQVELHPTRSFPIGVIVQAQYLDTVVHTWDVAAAIGDSFTPEPLIADAVLAIAETIPDDERRERPGAAFARARPSGTTPWHRALALLGRDPEWSAP